MKKVTTQIEVRYQETDQMGVVYHANYLIWFEIGRSAFIKELGLSYAKMEEEGVVSPVTRVEIDYKKPMHYGETAFIETWIEHYDGLRTTYGYQVTNAQGEVSVTGKTDHVIVKKESFRPISVRRRFPDWHESYLNAVGNEK
ncbi:acyl-CoA thioesterase [Amphibacillus sp. MSJ-3]|uniref:acyl-CoA thioesterase n=1 Tax=Amphibacillus sp. MSJ-3 TaxID=2841505 RepID=UPI001C0E9B17|nr:thioesterase family protein [Amphibacillus sp. MSJ-3]MBU5594183.1 acyl-CoA thioesterase [Amphibacillus sp. MSJ-3]